MSTHGLPEWPWTGVEPDALPRAERLLLDALRRWHEAARAGTPPMPALTLLLAAEDAAEAAASFDLLFRIIPVQAGCPHCPVVAPEEAALLLACALAQRGARSEALGALLRLLPLSTAYAAMPLAIHLGCSLRRAGLLMRHPLREQVRSRPARG